MKLGAHLASYIRAASTTSLLFRELETVIQVTRDQVQRAMGMMRLFGYVQAFSIEREEMKVAMRLSSLQRLRVLEVKAQTRVLAETLTSGANGLSAEQWSPQ